MATDAYVNDLPPGVPGYAAGAASPLVQVPSVAALRATGLPVAQSFQPAPLPIAPPAVTPPPQTLVQRAEALGMQAMTGLRQLLGMSGASGQPQPSPAPVSASRTNTLEDGLDALQRRSSSPNAFQMRQQVASK